MILKIIFVKEFQIDTTFDANVFIFIHVEISLSSKKVPYICESQLNCFERYQNIP